MRKKTLITIMLMAGLFNIAQAKEPTIEETADFIKKILNNDERSSARNESTEEKPVFIFKNKCKITIERKRWQYNNKKGDMDIWRNYVDLTKHKISYDRIGRYSSAGEVDLDIRIQDRQDLKSVITKAGHSTFRDYRTWVGVDVHGIYAKKFNRALRHLSKICYKKYGSTKSDDEPF